METNDEKKARVTFEQPEKKKVCQHCGSIPHWPIRWTEDEEQPEPEAAGQERVFDREDMAKAFVAGLLNRSDFTVDEFSEQLKTAQVKIDLLCDFLIQVNQQKP